MLKDKSPILLGLGRCYPYSLILYFFFLGCGAQEESPQALIEKRCSHCHTLEKVYAAKKTPEAWFTTVKKMAFYASGVIPDKEIPVIADYLSKNQGTIKEKRT